MDAKRINPILTVSDIRASFAWSEALGWEKAQSGMLAGLFDSVLYSLLPALANSLAQHIIPIHMQFIKSNQNP